MFPAKVVEAVKVEEAVESKPFRKPIVVEVELPQVWGVHEKTELIVEGSTQVVFVPSVCGIYVFTGELPI